MKSVFSKCCHAELQLWIMIHLENVPETSKTLTLPNLYICLSLSPPSQLCSSLFPLWPRAFGPTLACPVMPFALCVYVRVGGCMCLHDCVFERTIMGS